MKVWSKTIPLVDPMMVREVTPLDGGILGGVFVVQWVDLAEIGLASERLPFDADVIDCSYRVFEATTEMMLHPGITHLMLFPSRRWRNFRTGEIIERLPEPGAPLLFIGNPIRIWTDDSGVIVVNGLSEFQIKTGYQLQAEQGQ